MTVVPDDDPRPRPASRLLRFDNLGAVRGRLHSGRRVVIVAALVFLVTWGGLYLAFRDWRTRYRQRAAFGATRVATAVDPLAAIVPPELSPDAWRGAVAETHAMLVDLTASNLLSLDQMKALRAEIAARVARTRPETARDELTGLWNDLEDRSVPALLDRHPRPKFLPPRTAKRRE